MALPQSLRALASPAFRRYYAGQAVSMVGTWIQSVALMWLVQLMRDTGMTLLDVQWCTQHLASLGAIEISRRQYLALLAKAYCATR